MDLLMIELEMLAPGDDINPRRSGRKDGAEELQASIAAHGLLSPLLVRMVRAAPPVYGVVDGNRRLAALCALRDSDGSIRGQVVTDETPIPCHVVEDDETVREAALASNIIRTPLHAIDQFEAFAALEEKGLEPAEIAARFGVSERLVRQRIALGGLTPEIRQAWRDGELGRDALQTAEAFTLAKDAKQQVAVFHQLKKQGYLWPSNVKAALGATRDAATALRVIGADAYRAAGGDVVEDLFGEESAVSDPELAKRLLAEKIEATCAALLEDGWSFALPRDGVKDPWNWPEMKLAVRYKPDERKRKTEVAARVDELDQIEDDLDQAQQAERDRLDAEMEAIEQAVRMRAHKPDVKAQSGCLIAVTNGRLHVHYAVLKPAAAARAKRQEAAATAPASGSKPAISNALAHDLSVLRTIAAAEALAERPVLALRAVVAALSTSQWGSPLRINSEGIGAVRTTSSESFQEIFAALRNVPDQDLLEQLAVLAGTTLDMQQHTAGAQSQDHDIFVGELDANDFETAARKVFEPQAYFSRVSGDLCKAALIEIHGDAHKAPTKKPDLIAAAVEAATDHGWLPPELRHPSSAGASR